MVGFLSNSNEENIAPAIVTVRYQQSEDVVISLTELSLYLPKLSKNFLMGCGWMLMTMK